ncbi:MAG: cell division protein ZapA [Pseudomonadota bacterium]
MAEVAVRIGGREYRLGCGEGEEEGLINYAKRMDGIADAIQRRMSQPVPEGRLLVMVGMMLADELADAEAQTRSAQKDAAKARDLADSRQAPSDMFSEEAEEALTERIMAIADRIERLSQKFG